MSTIVDFPPIGVFLYDSFFIFFVTVVCVYVKTMLMAFNQSVIKFIGSSHM